MSAGLAGMWSLIQAKFSRQRSRVNVVRRMIELGVRVGKDERLYLSDVMIGDTALGRSAGVDRRVVRSTVRQILGDSELREIFSRIKPVGSSLVDVADRLGYSVLAIEADPYKPGVISSVTSVLAEHNVVVRQALAEDPDLIPEPRLTLVVEGSFPPEAISKIQSLRVVRSLTLLK